MTESFVRKCSMDNNIQLISTRLIDTSKFIIEYKEEYNKYIAQLLNNIQKLELKIKNLNDSLDEKNNEIEKLETKIKDLNDSLNKKCCKKEKKISFFSMF